MKARISVNHKSIFDITMPHKSSGSAPAILYLKMGFVDMIKIK